jgi:hypothetical protein
MRPVVAVVRWTEVGTWTIIVTRSVEERNGNWKGKSEVDTGARSRLSEKGQSRDDEQKYNKLFIAKVFDKHITDAPNGKS